MRTQSKKKLIVTNSLLLAFLIFGSVFAWFASNFKNYVAANEVQVVADGDLQLSVVDSPDNSQWSNSLTLSNYEWFKRTSFTDITGSGDGNFARPTLKLEANYASVVPDGTWTTPKRTNTLDNDETSTTKYDYVRFTLYMRSKTRMSVKLGPGSYVKPASMNSSLNELLGPTAPNISPLGQFSKDLVAGAVRVSAIKSDNSHFFTWIPRPEINANAVEAKVTDVSVTENSGSSYTHSYYSSEDGTVNTAFSKKDLLPAVTGDITDAKSQPLSLVTLSEEKDGNGFHTGQVDFCIWLEGCDNEARRAFVDGRFKVYLNLVAITE